MLLYYIISYQITLCNIIVCVYIYIYIYTCVYIYIYIYTHTRTHPCARAALLQVSERLAERGIAEPADATEYVGHLCI